MQGEMEATPPTLNSSSGSGWTHITNAGPPMQQTAALSICQSIETGWAAGRRHVRSEHLCVCYPAHCWWAFGVGGVVGWC